MTLKTIGLVLLLVLGGIDDFTKISKANQAKREAEELFKSKKYKEAAQKYKYVADTLKVSDEAMQLDWAHAMLKSNDKDGAYKMYKTLSQQASPTIKSIAALQLGNLEAETGNTDLALKNYKEALKANPNNHLARYNYELLKKQEEKDPKNNPNQKNQQNQQNQQNNQNQKNQQNQQNQQNNQNNQNQQNQKDNQQNNQNNKDNKGDSNKDQDSAKNQNNKNNQGKDGKENKNSQNKNDNGKGGDKNNEDSKQGKSDQKSSDPKDQQAKNQSKDGKEDPKDGDKSQEPKPGEDPQKGEKGNPQTAGKEGNEGSKNAKKGDKEIPQYEVGRLNEMGLTEEKAQMILNAMKNAEVQYLQQMQKQPTKRTDRSKPTW